MILLKQVGKDSERTTSSQLGKQKVRIITCC